MSPTYLTLNDLEEDDIIEFIGLSWPLGLWLVIAMCHQHCTLLQSKIGNTSTFSVDRSSVNKIRKVRRASKLDKLITFPNYFSYLKKEELKK